MESKINGVDDGDFVHRSCDQNKVVTETEQTASEVTWGLDARALQLGKETSPRDGRRQEGPRPRGRPVRGAVGQRRGQRRPQAPRPGAEAASGLARGPTCSPEHQRGVGRAGGPRDLRGAAEGSE